MKSIQINAVAFGSTGNIAKAICKCAIDAGNESKLVVPKSRMNLNKKDDNTIVFGSILLRNISALFERLFGIHGHLNFCNTVCLIRLLKCEKPNVIHIHNIHGSYINYRMLFRYLRNSNSKVVWTFHDCWPFTGRCPYFTLAQCEKWRTGCYNCQYAHNMYPEACLRTERLLWKEKRTIFTSLSNVYICTPSKWLADLTKCSFFNGNSISVINNGVNTKIFTEGHSNFREAYNISAKYIILGVAFAWGKRKGLDVFIDLSKIIGDDYQIVLVGTNDEIDNMIPSNIISIHKTFDVAELVEIYRGSDVFFNPTREEVFGLVNIEALACGTPVVTYNTGGSPECIGPKCGLVVENNSIGEAIKCIRQICEKKLINRDDCIKWAKTFDYDSKIREYIDLYEKIVKE